MRTIFLALAALAMTAPAYSQTTAPAAPSVTAGTEFKGIRLDWELVPGATWYQLEYRAHQTGPFLQHGANYPASADHIRFRLPLHLFDWTYARYRVAACNSAGCARSAAVSMSSLRRDAVGYFKPRQSVAGAHFGRSTDVSPDGLNFVAAAPDEPVAGSSRGGAIYVYRRQANGTWLQRARLTPPVPPNIWNENVMKVGISADGNTVVLGMPHYWSDTAAPDDKIGEAYIFHFNGASWVRTRLYSGTRGAFGNWVGINDAGDTVAIAFGAAFPSEPTQRVAIYKLIGGQWQPVRGITPWSGYSEYCYVGAFSRDGSTVAESCDVAKPGRGFETVIRTYSGPNWSVREDVPLVRTGSYPGAGNALPAIAVDGTGNTIVASLYENPNPSYLGGPVEVKLFTRNAGHFENTANFQPGAWRDAETQALFGRGLALSGDGGTLAIGDPEDNGYGTGPRAAPLNPGGSGGGVYIYRLKANWVLANMVKPNTNTYWLDDFGRHLSLNGNGQTLLVGNSGEGSNANGIGGDWNNHDGTKDQSGAVFMY